MVKPPMMLSFPKKLPLLVLDDEVIFPGTTIRISNVSPRNIDLVQACILKNSSTVGAFIGVVPSIKIGTVGTATVILQVTQISHEQTSKSSLLMTGLCRFKIDRIVMEEPYPVAMVTRLERFSIDEDGDTDSEVHEMATDLRLAIYSFIQCLHLPLEDIEKLQNMFDTAPNHVLPDMCMAVIKTSFNQKLKVLNSADLLERLKIVIELLKEQQNKISLLQNNKNTKLIALPEKTIKKAFNAKAALPLRPTLKPSVMNEDDDTIELQQKLKSAGLPSEVEKIIKKDLEKLSRIPFLNAEHSVLRCYLDLILDLPWNKQAAETLDIQKAKEHLDSEHYGLTKLKQRIIEYLAVRKLRRDSKDKIVVRDPVLCLVGPPGVGKTSIAQSIASTLGRPFCRVSLGGVNNHSDIRGHRRTYVGSMPGRIIQAIKQVHVNNPVILLDEIDKMTSGINGDPASALLEVLDPAQNMAFVDHYLNVPFDLSNVMFIATANRTETLPPALKDRLDLFHLPGYTNEEKLFIAENHLLPKQLVQNGLNSYPVQIPQETIKLLVNNYTREAGVRNLERNLGALCRAIAVRITEKNSDAAKSESSLTKSIEPIIVDMETAKNILGPLLYETSEWSSRVGRPGVSVGLGWSPVGGSILIVEVSKAPGKGKLYLTGQLGDVMKESATIAWGWLRAHAHEYNIQLGGDDVVKTDLYIHFPEGAVGKEGPSAGAAITCALFSLFSQRPLLTDVAMTGEITLQGVVLPVGGVKEKLLAAYRGGFKKIIIPKMCEKHLEEIPKEILTQLKIILVSNIYEVFQAAFEGGVHVTKPVQNQCKL